MYSFGLSVWSILTELRPYEDANFNGVKTEEEFYQLITNGVRPSLDAVRTWKELIEMCWQQVEILFFFSSFFFLSSFLFLEMELVVVSFFYPLTTQSSSL